MWQYDNMTMCQCGNVAMWQCGNVIMWECDDVAKWQYGNVAMWQCSNEVMSSLLILLLTRSTHCCLWRTRCTVSLTLVFVKENQDYLPHGPKNQDYLPPGLKKHRFLALSDEHSEKTKKELLKKATSTRQNDYWIVSKNVFC